MSRIVRLDTVQQFAAININSDLGLVQGPKLVDQCAEITLVWNIADGKLAHNVLGGRYTGGFAGTVAQANGILVALSTGAQWTALAAFIANTAALNSVWIRDINTADNPIISSTTPGKNGTSASPEMPDEVALCVTNKTSKTGPRYRGRFFVPGWATNSLQTGNVAADAAVSALNAWAGTIAAAFTAQGYTFCLALPARNQYTSPKTGTPFPARPKETPAVTQSVVRDNHWDSQRRRGLR